MRRPRQGPDPSEYFRFAAALRSDEGVDPHAENRRLILARKGGDAEPDGAARKPRKAIPRKVFKEVVEDAEDAIEVVREDIRAASELVGERLHGDPNQTSEEYIDKNMLFYRDNIPKDPNDAIAARIEARWAERGDGEPLAPRGGRVRTRYGLDIIEYELGIMGESFAVLASVVRWARGFVRIDVSAPAPRDVDETGSMAEANEILVSLLLQETAAIDFFRAIFHENPARIVGELPSASRAHAEADIAASRASIAAMANMLRDGKEFSRRDLIVSRVEEFESICTWKALLRTARKLLICFEQAGESGVVDMNEVRRIRIRIRDLRLLSELCELAEEKKLTPWI